MKKKWVYRFGGGSAEGSGKDRNLLGGKGADLAEMARLGFPVPPGFTLTTEVCTEFYASSKHYPEGLEQEVEAAMAHLGEQMGRRFGDEKRPLLVSVRSGARVSMPGMMDTVLNLGLNDQTVAGLAAETDPRFAYDSYRRFIQMYASVVLGLPHENFEAMLADVKAQRGVKLDTGLSSSDLVKLTEMYRAEVERATGKPFPSDVRQQLFGAMSAVFGSWMNARAMTYRRLHHISADWGTAVNIQAMVFGNRGNTSATGVAFTRSPSTGDRSIYGEYLVNAQGEDVVAGIRTPQPITRAAKDLMGTKLPSLEEAMPEVYASLATNLAALEKHYRDMQDVEFTCEEGKLWLLQTRRGKRTARAALKIAVDMVEEGLIRQEEAVLRIEPASLDQLLHPSLDPKAEKKLLAVGLPASPGAASGAIVFSSDEAVEASEAGRQVILVRIETSAEDIAGMNAAAGILTTRGGMTSHAAVVARGMGRACVAGLGSLHVDELQQTIEHGGLTLKAGDLITLDGSTGEVFQGAVPTVKAELSAEFRELMGWADRWRRMSVRANAETPEDTETARRFGAEGIGLCRTEHMFFQADRIVIMREMILADDERARRAALAKLLPLQRADFVQLFEIMSGFPVTVRLLDPPLHEFLPQTDAEILEVAKSAGIDPDSLRRRAQELHETNPMLGHRGCRLGITFPEIYEMQARAIFEAAVAVRRKTAKAVHPEVMIPLVALENELELMADLVERVAREVESESGIEVEYRLGTMIELPRAALRAGALAKRAAFFSFGTNDLTQTAMGLSRDDASKFLPAYTERGVLADDPFMTLDREGVGELIRIALERGRETRPTIELGICGEHGGDPRSIDFCQRVGLDYVSCSPYRVPIARLAAAQAALRPVKPV